MVIVIILKKNKEYVEFNFNTFSNFCGMMDFIVALGYEIITVEHNPIDLSHTIIAKEVYNEKEE